MNRVRIDFAPPGLLRGLLRASRPTWATLGALAVCGLALAIAGAALERRQDRLALLRAQSAARERAPARVPLVPRAQVPEAQAGAVNAVVLQLNLPWRMLRDAVQAGTPPAVALLALEPDARKRRVRITAEAKNSDDMLAYLARLQEIEWFGAVSLVRHEINEQDPNRPIRFQLDAQWRESQ